MRDCCFTCKGFRKDLSKPLVTCMRTALLARGACIFSVRVLVSTSLEKPALTNELAGLARCFEQSFEEGE